MMMSAARAAIFKTISTLWRLPPARTPKQLTTVSAPSAAAATAHSGAGARVTSRK